MSRNNRVIIKPEDKIFLMKLFDCSMSIVYKALSFKHDGKKSRLIRSYAMNHLKSFLI